METSESKGESYVCVCVINVGSIRYPATRTFPISARARRQPAFTAGEKCVAPISASGAAAVGTRRGKKRIVCNNTVFLSEIPASNRRAARVNTRASRTITMPALRYCHYRARGIIYGYHNSQAPLALKILRGPRYIYVRYIRTYVRTGRVSGKTRV